MKKSFKTIMLLLAVILVFASCTSIDVESKIADKVVAMTPIPEEIDHKIVGSFSQEMRVFFTINGLVPVSQVEIDEAIRDAIAKYRGDGVVNFRVNNQLSGIDILIQSGLGLGGYLLGSLMAPSALYAPSYGSIGAAIMQFGLQSRTLTISGDVFKLE